MRDPTVLDVVLARVRAEPNRLAAILGEEVEPLIAFDRTRNILAANDSAALFFRRDSREFIGSSVDLLIPPRFRQQDAQPPAVISDVTTVELPALRGGEAEVMTVWSFAAIEAPAGAIFLLTIRERSQVLAELEASTYAAMFEQSPVAHALLRVPDSTTVAVNQAFADLFEVRREDFIGNHSTALGIATEEQRAEIARILASGGDVKNLECERRTVSGKPLTVSLSITRVRVGGVDHLLSSVVDISARKAQEVALANAATALAESRSRADYAVRLSRIGFWYCDLPFDELVWDVQVKEHFFLPADARVTIETFYERIIPEDRERTRAAIDASIRDRELYDVNYRTHDPATGAIKWIRAMGGTGYAPDGTPLRFDGVTVDITAQKRNEERLATAAVQLEEANRVKDDFLAMLGHELRNPLSPITTAVQLFRLKGIEAREIDIIERQANHLTHLVDDLLDVSRISRGKVTLDKQPCEMSVIVSAALETVGPMVASAHHSLTTDVPERGLCVNVDRLRMVQAISNLLANAAKYTPPHGRIAVRAHREGNEVIVRVEDSGEGIPATLLPNVFDMFVQSRQTLARSQGGLGLGLAIVKSLVTLHDGQVHAESAGPGQGSAFTIRLPLAEDVPAPTRPAKSSVAPASSSRRVLVVDDNIDGAELISEALRMLGYQTMTVHDGARALDAADEFRPEIVFVDIGLPIIDGYELARRLRQKHPGVPMIAMTGYGQPGDKKRSRDAGFQEHLTKPVDLKNLADVLARVGSNLQR